MMRAAILIVRVTVLIIGVHVLIIREAVLTIRLGPYAESVWNNQNNDPDNPIDTGSVSTQAMSRLRTVPHCSLDPFAVMVPATPDDSTCVVLTGRPKASAAPMVTMAVISAAAP